MSAISVHGLQKTFRVKRKEAGWTGSLKALFKPRYEEKIAVHPLDLTAGEGEVIAFLGPNGAGKSTTIKMLTGILYPTSGEARVLGLNPWSERKRLAFKIGTVFGQKTQLWYHLPPVDTFELMARIYELDDQSYKRRRDLLIERFELVPYLTTPVRKLSLGERMRCEIVAALLHSPRVLFLDEPTIGLDVVAKAKIRDLIRELNREEQVTIFLTSHDAGDIEQLCSRAVVINHGQIILDDTVPNMKRQYLQMKTINLKLRTEAKDIDLPGVTVVKRKGQGMKLLIDTEIQTIERVLGHIVNHCSIEDVTIEDPSMEEVITKIYQATGRETG
jgi:ABC-2 type transport system ATP-binding protein